MCIASYILGSITCLLEYLQNPFPTWMHFSSICAIGGEEKKSHTVCYLTTFLEHLRSKYSIWSKIVIQIRVKKSVYSRIWFDLELKPYSTVCSKCNLIQTLKMRQKFNLIQILNTFKNHFDTKPQIQSDSKPK